MTIVRSRFDRQKDELYETEEWVTEALLRHLDITGMKVREPAAGNHKMVRVLQREATHVYASDIRTYSQPHIESDFFADDAWYPPEHCDALITNPPYGRQNRLAMQFAELALQRCKGWVALLLTAKFDSGKSRVHLFRDNPRFSTKIVLLDRIQWFDGEYGGTEDHAWFVWAPVGMTVDARLEYETRMA